MFDPSARGERKTLPQPNSQTLVEFMSLYNLSRAPVVGRDPVNRAIN
jgi:hypothetical protein